VSAHVGTALQSDPGSSQVAQIISDGYQIRYQVRPTAVVGQAVRRRESNPRTISSDGAALCKRSPHPQDESGSRRICVVLHRDDLAVLHVEHLRPLVALAVALRPRKRDHDAVATSLHRVEPPVTIACLPPPIHSRQENLTGLVGTPSGRWSLPEPRQPASSMPHQVRMNERDERIDVAGHECFVRTADRVGAHVEDGSSQLPSGASSASPNTARPPPRSPRPWS
jgi:hypothetical protein